MLRPYQLAAIDEIRGHLRSGCKRVLLVSPTGSGKTTIASEMILAAMAKKSRVLFIAHRRELIDQAIARLAEHGVEAGAIMAGRPKRCLPVQVASIQTIIRREFPPAEIVVVDECHHARANSHVKVLEHYRQSAIIGLTATPWRTDGKGMSPMFEASVVAATPKELIASGHLCDYDGKKYLAPDLTGVRTVAGDYDEEQLAIACASSRVVGDIIDRYMAHCAGQRGVVFASSIENSKHLVKLFCEKGIRAEHLDYTMGAERAAIVGRVRSGETTLISNVGILTEGVDIPELRVCILARPTKSLSLYLQMVGRCMRPKADGSRALIHDHGENVERHGLPDADRDYSLTADAKKNRPKSLKNCPVCFSYFDGPWPCPKCGHMPAAESVERLGPEGVSGVEVDIRDPLFADTQAARDAYKRELVALCIRKNLKPGFLVHKYLERYPNDPKPWGAFREVKNAQLPAIPVAKPYYNDDNDWGDY